MIRKLVMHEIDIIMNIWLTANISAHNFVSTEYWKGNYDFVKSAIQDAEVYVYEDDGLIKGFIGLTDCYIAGVFVLESFQSCGIGARLLSYIKALKPSLTLNVYSENQRAVAFYIKHGFVIASERIDEGTGHMELEMMWHQSSMKKVLVIGCPGSGKSTFSRRLYEKTNLPIYYLDMIWHKPDKTTVLQEEFDKRLSEILVQDRWIIDGNYIRTLDKRLKACDTVYLLDMPVDLCLDGAISRIGKVREDLPWIEEELDEEFKKWIEDFPEKQLPETYSLLSHYQHEKNIIVFKSRVEVDNYLKHM